MKFKDILSKLIVLSICFLMMSANAVKAEDSSISINHVYVTYEESSNVQTSLLSSGLSEQNNKIMPFSIISIIAIAFIAATLFIIFIIRRSREDD